MKSSEGPLRLGEQGPLSCLSPSPFATPESPQKLSLPLPLPLPLFLSRLSCFLPLDFGVSTSASFRLCHCLFLSSLLLLAPVDIKVIKDLPWPPPVGQLDSSPSLPDGDRDISGPASPLPEPSLEDGSGGSCGAGTLAPSFWGFVGLSWGLRVGLVVRTRKE